MDDTLLQLYFEGKTSDEQSRLITEWLKQENANLLHYQRICRLYEINLWNKKPEREKAAKKVATRRSVIRETLKVTAFIALGYFLHQQLNVQKEDVEMQSVWVPAGQNSQVILADGSKVWLNAGSVLHFPTRFSDKQRLVSLEGEGFFDVQANKDKPFIVSTSTYQIKAIGTTFNVYAYGESPAFETSLLTGKVEISDYEHKQTITLSPGNRAVLANGKLRSLPVQEMDHLLWREGILYFNGPLEDVFDKLELYFDVNIVINDTNKKKYKQLCTGKFRTRDGLKHILHVLQLTHRFSYTVDDEKNVVFVL